MAFWPNDRLKTAGRGEASKAIMDCGDIGTPLRSLESSNVVSSSRPSFVFPVPDSCTAGLSVLFLPSYYKRMRSKATGMKAHNRVEWTE